MDESGRAMDSGVGKSGSLREAEMSSGGEWVRALAVVTVNIALQYRESLSLSHSYSVSFPLSLSLLMPTS